MWNKKKAVVGELIDHIIPLISKGGSGTVENLALRLVNLVTLKKLIRIWLNF